MPKDDTTQSNACAEAGGWYDICKERRIVLTDVMLHSNYTVSSTSQNKWHLQHYMRVFTRWWDRLPVLHFPALEPITHPVGCYLPTVTWAFIYPHIWQDSDAELCYNSFYLMQSCWNKTKQIRRVTITLNANLMLLALVFGPTRVRVVIQKTSSPKFYNNNCQ